MLGRRVCLLFCSIRLMMEEMVDEFVYTFLSVRYP
jgi:hypothetical protein